MPTVADMPPPWASSVLAHHPSDPLMPTPMLMVETKRTHNSDTGGRHHPGEVYRTDATRARALAESGAVDLVEDVDGVNWENPRGRILSPLDAPSLYATGCVPGAHPRVLQLTQYDPGSAAYRYHSAANVGDGGSSAFVRFGHSNPHSDLRQFDGGRHNAAVRKLMGRADVVHVHMDYSTLEAEPPMGLATWPRSDQLLIRHYHGSEPESFTQNGRPGDWPRIMERAWDDRVGALHIGARLYHHRLSERMHWLPIPMPCRDYAALRDALFVPIEGRANGKFRIAHSATNPHVKGTVAVQTAVADLQAKGVPVELVLIMGKSHADALKIKATCDVTFDSFWLGIQGSGLEGAAMGQAVIAGDPEARDEYERYVGYCPYTFAKGYDEVKPVIERMVYDAEWRAAEAARVGAYVREVHDYPVVGARYWEIVRNALRERGVSA